MLGRRRKDRPIAMAAFSNDPFLARNDFYAITPLIEFKIL